MNAPALPVGPIYSSKAPRRWQQAFVAGVAIALSACGGGGGGDDAPSSPAPTVTLTASPTTADLNGTVELTWSSTDATSCTAGGRWAGARATAGTETSAALAGSSTFSLTCTGAGGSSTATRTVAISPPTTSLTAMPTNVFAGFTTSLTWTSTNALACSASGAWTGTKAAAGTETSPAVATNSDFSIACTGPGGTHISSVRVEIVPSAAPAISMTASASVVRLGETAQIVWSAEGVTSCVATGDWSGQLQLSGATGVQPAAAVNTYAISCSGPNGSATKSLSITVDDQRPISVSLDTDISAAVPGTDVILSWLSTGATQCTASGSWSGTKNPRGFEIRGPITATSQFSLTCSGATGSATDTATVTLLRPPILSFRAVDPDIYEGEAAVLEWTAQYATACVASEGWSGVKPTSGTESTGALVADTSFRLLCEGEGGTAASVVTVTVAPPPEPSLTFDATETTVVAGAISILRWSALRLGSCVASGDWSGTREASGDEPVGPLDANRSYTLTCAGANGAHTETVAITVVPRPPSPADAVVTLISAEFVTIGGRPEHEGWQTSTSEPVLDGAQANLLVELTGTPQSAEVTLIDDLGGSLASFTLSPFTETSDDADFFGSLSLPAQRFTLRISGLDAANQPYVVASRQFNPVPFSLEFPTRRIPIALGSTVELPFTVKNAGPTASLRVEFSGLFAPSQSQTFSLSQGDSLESTVTVFVPDTATITSLEDLEGRVVSTVDVTKLNRASVVVEVIP